MDVKLTETEAAFDLPEWKTLLLEDPRRHIFSTPEWARVWWEAFGEGKRLATLTFLDPHPVAITSLMFDTTEEGKRIRFLGGDDLTDYLGPIIAGDIHIPAVADALVGFITDELPGWDYFDAKCLPVPFRFAEWLAEAAHRRQVEFHISQDELSAVIALPSSYEEYVEALPGKKRHELRRKTRRFQAQAPGADLWRADDSDIERSLARFIEMHRASEGDKGAFMTPKRQRFFERVVEEFEPLGWLSLDFLEYQGREIAATFSFDFGGVFYLYNSAYLLDLRPLSPGLIMVTRLIERAIEQKLTRFDFLRGRERYKFDLGGQALPLHSVRIVRPT